MHDAAFAALGIDARYLAWDVPPAELAAAVAALRAPDVLGANVTIPHKRAALRLMDRLTDVARAVGAVNTVVPTRAGLEGDNTDVAGFLAALAELGPSPRGSTAVVLGAGGAARAVVVALSRAGARVRLYNRTVERAAAVVRAVGSGIELLAPGELAAAVGAADLVVNATSVGMAGAAPGSPLPKGVLPRAGAVVDLVYRPTETPLLRDARAAGIAVQNGLPMLVQQGAASFERWTGRAGPVAVMRAAAERALA